MLSVMRPTRFFLRLAIVATSLMALVVFAAVALLFFYDDRTVTRFDSPSGKWRLSVVEGCLGHACAHSAYLEERSLLWSTRRECPFVLHGDGIAFEKGSVTWNANETALDWYTPTFNVEGHINFARDCMLP